MKAKKVKSDKVLQAKSNILANQFDSEVLPLLRDSGLAQKKTSKEDLKAQPEIYNLAITLQSIFQLYHSFNHNMDDILRMRIWEILSGEEKATEKEQIIKSIRQEESRKLNLDRTWVNKILINAHEQTQDRPVIWPMKVQEKYNKFFEDSVSNRVYYRIPKVKGVDEVAHSLEQDYGIKIHPNKEGAIVVEHINGEDVPAESFLNSGSKALASFLDKISELSPDQFELVKARILAAEKENLPFSTISDLRDINDRSVTQTLGSLFRNHMLYDIFLKELKNHPEKDMENFISSANNIKDKFTSAKERIHKFSMKRKNNGENSNDDNGYDTIVFSRNPIDIALMSTYKEGFSSCMTAYKPEAQQYLHIEIAARNMVIYATTSDDLYLSKIKGRTLGRAYYSNETDEVMFKSEKFYGSVVNLVETAQEIMDEDLNPEYDFFSGALPKNLYFDGWAKTITEMSPNISTERFLDNLGIFYEQTDQNKIIANGDIALSKYECYSLRVLEKIAKINGDLSIKGAKFLDNLKHIPNETTGTVTLFNNAKLTDLKGLNKINSVGRLVIRANTKLTSLKGLPPDVFNGGLSITSCPKLKSLKGMPKKVLGNVEVGYLHLNNLSFLPKEIEGNITLHDLTFPEGTKNLVWETTMSKEEAMSKLKCDKALKSRIIIKSSKKSRPKCAAKTAVKTRKPSQDWLHTPK